MMYYNNVRIKHIEIKNEISHFIPDQNSGAANDRLVNSGAITAGAATPINHATNNADFNPGYERRRQLFNYTVAGGGNDSVRNVECFIRLSDIFGFCEGFTKLLKFVSFEIELTRKAAGEYQDCVFGAAPTGISFGNTDNTGLLHIQLEIEQIIPSDEISIMLDIEF